MFRMLGVLLTGFAALGMWPAEAAEKPKIVVTFSILADLTAQVAGGRADIVTLVGPDGDAHVFEPGPKDSAALAAANLLVANGLGFEPWLDRLSEAAGFKGALVVASAGITPLSAGHAEEHDEHVQGTEADGDHDGEEGHDQGAFDPHAFQDLANGQVYVINIAKGLSQIDPAHAAEFQANAQGLAAAMADLDATIRADFAAIPAERRRVLTSHDAFRYFSRAYGVEFLAIHGISTEAEPSAQDLGKLVEQARAGNITAVFVENMADPRLADTVSAESGIRVGGQLYADALSPADGPAPDYLSLFRHNAKQLLDALR